MGVIKRRTYKVNGEEVSQEELEDVLEKFHFDDIMDKAMGGVDKVMNGFDKLMDHVDDMDLSDIKEEEKIIRRKIVKSLRSFILLALLASLLLFGMIFYSAITSDKEIEVGTKSTISTPSIDERKPLIQPEELKKL